MAIVSATKTRLGAYGGPRGLYGDFAKSATLTKGGGFGDAGNAARLRRLRLQQAIKYDDEEIIALMLAEGLIRRH